MNIAELEPGRRYRIRWPDPAPGSELDYGCPLAEYIGPMHFDAEGNDGTVGAHDADGRLVVRCAISHS